MMLRSFLKTMVATLSLALIGTASLAADKLIVATDTAFVPFEFKQDGQYTGFDIQLWDALAKQAELDYELQPMDFNGIIPGLQTRNIDLALAGITITDERKQVVAFSDPYYESGLAILVPVDSDIQSADDLKGKTVAVKTGTVGVDYMKKNLPEAKLTLFPNIDNAFLELATQRVDAVVHDTPNVQYYANTSGKDKVKVVDSVKSGDFYGIAFPKDSELVTVVNEALTEIKNNGTYDEIYERWFGKQID